ncbi:Peroxisomal membrane protein PMP27 [Coemansia sp. RSA 989]|nr:peroxisomal biogenesis factor 11 [Coemansia mojavensis]KAJ1739800.1 Peroxisomal membrane protein PMP27 [Coemansia sp. RSA 1086]KAJ1748232.1 Peroxisomal membrane protein PMP27 [Coemansia sp. RSA 1821]KAJ1862374.1 Peroxisomal membrane protein PMP27 [Coemansia sp. RSA 989]KAJ1870203.1 Peroxisomal membrane protein PMP27 [Coemansia sp. RSA 990]KAJ2646517.1 Peroxisomal membrane protein PMP27 [Coemansia sp. RSA 1250]KAJ2669006.1 Peroxisomal membrane protein PMP27 [Coemansia sp. RSA 1085]
MTKSDSLALAVANSQIVNVYVKYINSLVGRDKACRLGQYFARLLAYMISRRISLSGKTPSRLSWLTSLVAIQQTLSTTRKVMRSGKFVSFMQQAVRTLFSQQDEVEKAFGLVHKLGMSVFMLADWWGLLNAMKLIRIKNAARVARVGQRAWMYALLAQLLSALYQLHQVSLRAADLQRVRLHVEKAGDVISDRECAVEEQAIGLQKSALRRQLVTAALDLTIPVKGLGILPLNEGVVALAGTVTSLLGIEDVLVKK